MAVPLWREMYGDHQLMPEMVDSIKLYIYMAFYI